jgi:hypothetical protein
MALFMQRLGAALTPTWVFANQSFSVNPSTDPTVCQTADYTVDGFPRSAIAWGTVALTGTAPSGYARMFMVASTDGGTTWSQLANARVTWQDLVPNLKNSMGLPSDQLMPLLPGKTYRFGIRVDNYVGTVSGPCTLAVMIQNQNGSTAPFDAPPPSAGDPTRP